MRTNRKESAEQINEYQPERDGAWIEGFGVFFINPRNPVMIRYCEPQYQDERILKGVEETEKGLIQLKDLAGDKLVVIVFPFKHQVHWDVIQDLVIKYNWDLEKPDRIVLEMCKRHNIKCFDILDAMRAHRDKKPFWDYDQHFTKAGHYYASLEIERVLRKNHLIGPGRLR